MNHAVQKPGYASDSYVGHAVAVENLNNSGQIKRRNSRFVVAAHDTGSDVAPSAVLTVSALHQN
jgi:hypothetical protein